MNQHKYHQHRIHTSMHTTHQHTQTTYIHISAACIQAQYIQASSISASYTYQQYKHAYQCMHTSSITISSIRYRDTYQTHISHIKLCRSAHLQLVPRLRTGGRWVRVGPVIIVLALSLCPSSNSLLSRGGPYMLFPLALLFLLAIAVITPSASDW